MIPLGRVHLKGSTTRSEDIRALGDVLAATRGESLILRLEDEQRVRYCTFLNGQAHSAADERNGVLCASSPRDFAAPIRAGVELPFALHEGSPLSLLYVGLVAHEAQHFEAPTDAVNAEALLARSAVAGLAVLRDGGEVVLAYVQQGRVRQVQGLPAADDAGAAFLAAVAGASSGATLGLYNELQARPSPESATLKDLLQADQPPAPLLFILDDERTRAQRAGDEILLGRAPECDVVVNDARVSRQHAVLRWEKNHYVIVDLDSRRGTSVSGERITAPTWVKVGDRLRLGGVEVRIEAPSQNLEDTVDTAAELRGPVAPHLIANARAVHIDRKVFRVTSGTGGHLELRGVPGVEATLLVDGSAVILQPDAGAQGITVNRETVTTRRRLFSGDQIQFGNVPCVFAMMVPAPRTTTAVDDVLAAFVQEP